MGASSTLRQQIIIECHNSPLGCHSGIVAVQWIKKYFHWSGIRRLVTEWIHTYDICQRYKTEHCALLGLLQTLPVVSHAWQHISMDFIEKLARSMGYDTIWIFIDRFTNFDHFIPLRHPFSAASLAEVYFEQLFKLYGALASIVSDRD